VLLLQLTGKKLAWQKSNIFATKDTILVLGHDLATKYHLQGMHYDKIYAEQNLLGRKMWKLQSWKLFLSRNILKLVLCKPAQVKVCVSIDRF
jgi:hypothetical protein